MPLVEATAGLTSSAPWPNRPRPTSCVPCPICTIESLPPMSPRLELNTTSRHGLRAVSPAPRPRALNGPLDGPLRGCAGSAPRVTQGTPPGGVGFLHFSYRPVRFDPECDPFLQQFYSQLEPTQGKSLQVLMGRKAPCLLGFSMISRGGQGRGRTADLPIFSRTLVPTELPGRAGR